MKLPRRFFATFISLGVMVASLPASTATPILPNVTHHAAEVIDLWPGPAPGETGEIGPEIIVPERPRPFDQLTNVSVPTLTVFQPAPGKRTGTGILLIPGGGLERLAIEHEGYEAAEWLNEHGLTVFLLKYRVPARDPAQRWKAGLQDAQRAMSLIRAHAARWKVDPDAIGSLGFSSGAELNVLLSVYHADARQYPPIDAADSLSTRPDFNIAVYGGGFADQPANTLRNDITARLNQDTPPMFIVHAFDDQALSSIILMNALKRANIASELHLFAAGGHGFGVRDTGLPVGQWRELCLNWLAWQGYLDSAEVRTYARKFLSASDQQASALPRFGATAFVADLPAAYAVQHRVVRQALVQGGAIAGFKGAQGSLGVTEPVYGVLFKAGRMEAAATTSIILEPKRPVLIETGIGYLIAVDIGTKLRVPRQAITAVESLVPVVALPVDLAPLMGGKIKAADAIAANFGSGRFIVGAPVSPKIAGDPDALSVMLQRDGQTLHTAAGASVEAGQAKSLMTLINQIIDAGYVIHRGDLVVCSALGGAQPGNKGRYTATFGPLGTITFELQ